MKPELLLNNNQSFIVKLSTILLLISIITFGQSNCPTCPPGTQIRSLVNVDFESGSYSIDAACAGEPVNPIQQAPCPGIGQFTITTANASTCNTNWLWPEDHTPGPGNHYLLCDGIAGSQTYLFRKTVNVVKGKTYIFCAWFANVVNYDMAFQKPKFEMRINHITGNSLQLNNQQGWELRSKVWVATITGSVPIEILITTTEKMGNDVALDDITFSECNEQCQCNDTGWGSIAYEITTASGPKTSKTTCGGILTDTLCAEKPAKFIFNYSCTLQGTNCSVTYKWEVRNFTSSTPVFSGSSQNAVFTPTVPGEYSILITAFCDGKPCPQSCRIKFIVKDCNQCSCLDWGPVQLSWFEPTGESKYTLECGGKWSLGNVCVCNKITLKYNFKCSTNNCSPKYSWEIKGPNGYQVGPSTSPASGSQPNNFVISFIPTVPGIYTVITNAKCGNNSCRECIIKIEIKNISLCSKNSNIPVLTDEK